MSRHRRSSAFRSIKSQLGPTGQFPAGKIHDGDEGAVRMAIGTHEGNVILDFGKPISWVGFPPAQAIELAHSIIEKANEALGGRTQ